MCKVGVFGAGGRVGKIIVDLLTQDDNLVLASVFVRKSLDFSLPPSTLITND